MPPLSCSLELSALLLGQLSRSATSAQPHVSILFYSIILFLPYESTPGDGLLTLNDDGSFSLVWLPKGKIPPYAILSLSLGKSGG